MHGYRTGILGGVYALIVFDSVKDIPSGVYLIGFFSNYPTQQIMDEILAFRNKKPCSGLWAGV